MALPTPASLKERYPQFSAYPDATVQAVIDDAAETAAKGDSWPESARARAVLLYACHLLIVEDPASGSDSTSLRRNQLASSSIGAASEAYSVETETEALKATIFGMRYLRLLRTVRGTAAIA